LPTFVVGGVLDGSYSNRGEGGILVWFLFAFPLWPGNHFFCCAEDF
jgi:hypothetical protein